MEALEQQITSGLGEMRTTMEGEIKALKDEHAGALRQWERRLAQVEDCAVLLASKDTLAGTGALNWSADVSISDWDGVSLTESSANVAELLLTGKGLTGSIPPQIGRLSSLEWLELDDNDLTGSIPAELGNLSNLKHLYLFGNRLTGAIPPELGDLTSLRALYLARNGLDGEIPSALGNLNKLDELILSGNALSGSIPGSLGSLSALTSLWLRDNDLSGQIPVELVEIPSLGELFLSDNQLIGCVPVGLREVASNDLGSLGLSDCKAPEPENVVATSTGATTIDLSWDEVDDTTVYRVEYRARRRGPLDHPASRHRWSEG